MPGQFLSAVILLLLVVDPFGSVPLVNTMLADVPLARRRRVVLRECGVAFAILAAFMAFGPQILAVMRLSETSLTIAGGVILFMIAIRMVFPTPEGIFGLQPQGEPLIVPLATPLIAGPSALAAVMLLASNDGAARRRAQRHHGGGHGDPARGRATVEMLLSGIRAFVEDFR
jgi:small neutral amino acid transporter SnatA (MarC family)